MWRIQTSGSVFISCRSLSWSLTRIYPLAQWLPGSHPGKFKTCLVSARCICIKPHPLCIDLRQALPPRPNHLLLFLSSNTRADESATFDLAWSSSSQSTELYTTGKNIWHRHPQWFLKDSRIVMRLLQGLPFWKPFLLISWYSPNSNFL